MPNEPLISQLDTLYAVYLQQQKTAAALQKAFKAVTDAQNKAQKTLREYSAQITALTSARHRRRSSACG